MAGSENGVVIVSAARTPVGSFNGSLSALSAAELGTVAIKAVMERAKVEPGEVGAAQVKPRPTAAAIQQPRAQCVVGRGIQARGGILRIGAGEVAFAPLLLRFDHQLLRRRIGEHLPHHDRVEAIRLHLAAERLHLGALGRLVNAAAEQAGAMAHGTEADRGQAEEEATAELHRPRHEAEGERLEGLHAGQGACVTAPPPRGPDARGRSAPGTRAPARSRARQRPTGGA